MVAVVAPSIVLSRACTALSLFPAFVSGASFFAGRGRLGPPPIRYAFAHRPAHQRCRSAILPAFVGCEPFAAARRAMSTSLGASSEGLSDIGQHSSASNNISDNTDKMPSWKERIDVSIAKSRKIRGSNYVQISTVDYEAMEPRCRTVVFRGFLKGAPDEAMREVLSGGGALGGDGESGSGYDCVMKMITDKRSSKVKELERYYAPEKEERGGNTAEMVWWFPKSSEQYRIRGRLQYVGSDGPLFSYSADGAMGSDEVRNYLLAERKQQWGNLSDPAREQFYWQNPGIPYASTENDEENGVPPGGRDGDGKVLPPPDTFLLMLLYPSTIDYLRLGDNYRQIDEWEESCRWKSMRVSP